VLDARADRLDDAGRVPSDHERVAVGQHLGHHAADQGAVDGVEGRGLDLDQDGALGGRGHGQFGQLRPPSGGGYVQCAHGMTPVL
jgi:hypothetical protein